MVNKKAICYALLLGLMWVSEVRAGSKRGSRYTRTFVPKEEEPAGSLDKATNDVSEHITSEVSAEALAAAASFGDTPANPLSFSVGSEPVLTDLGATDFPTEVVSPVIDDDEVLPESLQQVTESVSASIEQVVDGGQQSAATAPANTPGVNDTENGSNDVGAVPGGDVAPVAPGANDANDNLSDMPGLFDSVPLPVFSGDVSNTISDSQSATALKQTPEPAQVSDTLESVEKGEVSSKVDGSDVDVDGVDGVDGVDEHDGKSVTSEHPSLLQLEPITPHPDMESESTPVFGQLEPEVGQSVNGDHTQVQPSSRISSPFPLVGNPMDSRGYISPEAMRFNLSTSLLRHGDAPIFLNGVEVLKFEYKLYNEKSGGLFWRISKNGCTIGGGQYHLANECNCDEIIHNVLKDLMEPLMNVDLPSTDLDLPSTHIHLPSTDLTPDSAKIQIPDSNTNVNAKSANNVPSKLSALKKPPSSPVVTNLPRKKSGDQTRKENNNKITTDWEAQFSFADVNLNNQENIVPENASKNKLSEEQPLQNQTPANA